MKVTFLLPNVGLSGGNRVVAIYADHLRRRGYQVNLAALPYRSVSLINKAKSLVRGRGWPRARRETTYFEQLRLPVHILDEHRPIADSDLPDADVVVATWWETAEWAAVLNPRKGAKVYFVQHHEVFPHLDVKRSSATYRLPLHKIVISKWLEEAMADLYGDRNTSLIFNSVDTNQFHAPERSKQPVPTVGFLYAKVDFKGVDVILAALKILKLKRPDLKAVAFGSEVVSDKLPLPEWVNFHFQPPQDEIRLLYAQCDIWMCGSRSEGFHLPPLEAMACRCPVVSTKVGGPVDIIVDGVNGFLVDVNDSASLADRALHVLNLQDNEWRAMSDAALQTTLRYTWEDATLLFERALIKAKNNAASSASIQEST